MFLDIPGNLKVTCYVAKTTWPTICGTSKGRPINTVHQWPAPPLKSQTPESDNALHDSAAIPFYISFIGHTESLILLIC